MRKPLEVVSSALGAAAKGSRLRNSNSGNAVLPDAARTQHHELSSNNLSMKRFQDLNITQNGDRRDIEQLSGQRIARSVSGLSESSCLASAVTKMTKCSYMDTGSSPPPMNRRQTVDDAMAASNGQATSMVLAAGPPSARLPGQNATEPQTTPQEDATDTATFPFRLSFTAPQKSSQSQDVNQRKGIASRGEMQLTTYDATLKRYTRFTIRPVFLLLLTTFFALFALTLLSLASFLLSTLVSSLMTGSPSFHSVNSVLLTMMFVYSLLRQFLDYLRALVQPRRRIPVNLQSREAGEDPPGQPVVFNERSWWSTWNEKDRPR